MPLSPNVRLYEAARRSAAPWCIRLCGSLVLFLGLMLRPGHSAPASLHDTEGLIIAVDVSRAMRKQLPEVRRAIQALVRGLDRQRPYRTILVRFGNTIDEVLDLTLQGEVAHGVLHTAVQRLRANQQRIQADALLAYLQRKSASLGLEQVAVLVYSNGFCSGQPTSGKSCPGLTDLGTALPLQGLIMYVLRFPALPATPAPPTMADGDSARFHAIEARLESIADLTHGIAQRLDTPPPPPAPVLITLALPPPQAQHEAPGAVTQTPTQKTGVTSDTPVSQVESIAPMPLTPHAGHPEEPSDTPQATVPPGVSIMSEDAPESSAPVQPPPAEGKPPRTMPWSLLAWLGAGIGGSLVGLRRWRTRFHPVLLTVSLDGVRYETPIETVPAELALGPTLGCDILVADLPAPCHLLISQRLLVLRVAPAWQMSCGETRQTAVSHDGGAASYTLTCGLLYRLTTPHGDHWLVVEQSALQARPDAEHTDDPHTSSQLSLLGIREGDAPWQP